MKETIKYYYNLDTDNIEELEGKYHFKINNIDYFFVYYNRKLDELDDILLCCRGMKEKYIDCHDILINRNNEILTKINDYFYILLRVNNMQEEYNILDIVNFNKKLTLNNIDGKIYRNNWSRLWSDKIDYFEYQIRELGIEKNIVGDTFSYYLGLAENAISYVNSTNANLIRSELDKVVLSHRRIFYPNLKLNYMNPLSFVFDLEVRDIAEYLKSMFFSDNNSEILIELTSYLKSTRLSTYGYQMLYARLLYPSYYFDAYEEIMNNGKDEDVLVSIVAKNKEYELFLKTAYLEISKYAVIEKVNWLIS